MKVTLFIGNGFDIGMNLKTRYSDFYSNHYLKVKSENQNVERWKEKIKKDFRLWSDLETHLKVVANSLDDEEVLGFMEFVEDLAEELSVYLDGENARVIFDDYSGSVRAFYTGLGTIDRRIKEAIPIQENGLKIDQSVFTILNFNYTDSVERLLGRRSQSAKMLNRPAVIHPHGDLCLSIVVGISGMNRTFSEDNGIVNENREELRKWIIKERVLQHDMELRKRASLAFNTVDASDVICIYGMSMGESDVLWWDRIAKWLLIDDKHRLIIFAHSVKQNTNSRVPRRRFLDRGEQIKDNFLANCRFKVKIGNDYKSIEEVDGLREKIFVLPSTGIFDIKISENMRIQKRFHVDNKTGISEEEYSKFASGDSNIGVIS